LWFAIITVAAVVSNYDPAIWYSWMVHLYLATITHPFADQEGEKPQAKQLGRSAGLSDTTKHPISLLLSFQLH